MVERERPILTQRQMKKIALGDIHANMGQIVGIVSLQNMQDSIVIPTKTFPNLKISTLARSFHA
jgi:hypothetical protein